MDLKKVTSEETGIEQITLKVAHLEKMTIFYEKIGLKLIKESPGVNFLGVADDILLVLKEIKQPLRKENKVGLFHVAFLLPERKNLGTALKHYLALNILTGASDHGYSEALYLNDPEGNGIEVYWDKPKKMWDIREGGRIVGVTKSLDLRNLLEESTEHFSGFPKNSKIGHVHLKVRDLKETENFYVEQLGLQLKDNYGTQAKFFAAGSYHHHIGANTWAGTHLPLLEKNDLGLEEIVFTHFEIKNLEKEWEKAKLNFASHYDYLKVTDPNGILLKIKD